MLSCLTSRYPDLQVHDMTEKLAQFTDIRAALVVGGMSLTIQASTLRSRPEIVIGTPVSLSLFSPTLDTRLPLPLASFHVQSTATISRRL